ncbi:ATP-binding cassette domain-containing protein [Candidatus Berkiella aquae]|uniref:ATP-binding cassette domain-containing protein n=1 Tax=Candidatus Berkiella aquae TaxID=295108 RepID=A0A0Q9YNQ5_9GAMM|nr:ATP-binding cassette domain-containing protein [Candidatus Berkiella aquae]MCS5712361.1 ATP-binding cassette domain-containing protein [Candidatus Berkiella aquae]
MSSEIRINDVTKIFADSKPALDHISATVRSGHVTGLVGPDAAGKTTLLRLIAGLMHPTSGTITVCGYDTVQESTAIQDILGYMPQKFGLYEDLTVMENLNLHASLRSISVKERGPIFDKMLHFTDLTRFTKRLAGKLSGGMKQKLGLACALLSHPRVLLLDEPSVGVDPISRRELWKMVQELLQDGMAVIWATSYLDEAEQCNEVLLLNDGHLYFSGPPQTLTASVSGRTYLVSGVETDKRKQFLALIQKPEVVDGIVQGNKIRLLLKEHAQLTIDEPLNPTPPRFEDAFIDILQGKYTRKSRLAEKIAAKHEKKTTPIVAKNLTKCFGNFTAANNISFSIHKGEIFGLLGPNGAGKSTTFKMLCGLLQPTSGVALVSGHDLKTSSSKARSRIGYMAQKFSLYGTLSVKQNLEFFAGIYGLKGAERKHRTQEMIEIFDLKAYLQMNAEELPLGFKQRLALASAVMHEPDVLFLDEPTSGVDPLTRREFWVHINAMVEKGITIMVTTHFMDEAEYCDRIALIYRGQNIAADTPDNLKKQIATANNPDPTLEDAFIEIVQRFDKTTQDVLVNE